MTGKFWNVAVNAKIEFNAMTAMLVPTSRRRRSASSTIKEQLVVMLLTSVILRISWKEDYSSKSVINSGGSWLYPHGYALWKKLQKQNWNLQSCRFLDLITSYTRLKKRAQVQIATLSLLGAKHAKDLVLASRRALIVHNQEVKTILMRSQHAGRVTYTLNVLSFLK